MKAKKSLSVILSLALMLPLAPAAMADDAGQMRSALETVKAKISVPDELSEFQSNSYKNGDTTRYSFIWSNADGDRSMNVDCDEKGRVLYYHRFISGYYKGEQKLPTVTEEQAKSAAEAFLAKAAPETVENPEDRLEFEYARGGYDNGYSVSFRRMKNGVPVNWNTAYIMTELSEDGEIYISNASISYSYDAQFEAAATKIEAPEEKYKETYPAEMVYKINNDYSLYRNGSDAHKTRLVYRIKDGNPGYISAYTGEIVEQEAEEKAEDALGYMSMETAAANDSGAGLISPQEISELETVAGLYTAAEAEAFLKSVPQLKIDKNYKVESSSVYTETLGNGEDKDKSYRLDLNMTAPGDEYGSIYSAFDAERKRLTHYSNYSYDPSKSEEKELTEKEKTEAYAQTDEFLALVLPDKIAEFEDVTDDIGDELTDNVYKNYRRVVNGVPYIDNTMRVTYDAKNKKVIYYSLTYDDKAEFTATSGAVSADEAYEYMEKLAPIKEMYIHSGGIYRLVYAMDGSPMIDAFTGEDIYKDDIDYAEIEYNDISGHWCEEAVDALTAYGIGLPGESLKPDSVITQEELLRIFVSGINSRYYIGEDADSVYDYCYRNGILTKSDRNDDAAVPREQAFVYMIRLAGYDKVASLPDIYKVSYSDGNELSDGLIGYAAILSGMGIIAGDGGALRPKDSLTRAEAMMMLYRYMK